MVEPSPTSRRMVHATAALDPEQYYSPKTLAALLSVPITSVYEWNYQGTGPRRIRVGRHVRYRRADVDAWLDQHAETTGTAA